MLDWKIEPNPEEKGRGQLVNDQIWPLKFNPVLVVPEDDFNFFPLTKNLKVLRWKTLLQH